MRRLAAGVRKSAGTRRSSADTPPDGGKGINTVSLPLATIMVMVLASSATRAAQQTVLFEGTVTGFTQITGSLATDLASLGVTVGATITGSYAYDSEAPDQISSACAGLARSSGWPSHGLFSTVRRSSSPTSRPATLIRARPAS